MDKLIAGVAIFWITHLIPSFPSFRERLVSRLKPSGYKVLFSILSLISVVLMVMGLKSAEYTIVYNPAQWGYTASLVLMFPALYLFMSNSVSPIPSSAQYFTANPVSWGVVLWSFGHLLANGDSAHVLFFASFLAFSGVSIYTTRLRGKVPLKQQRPPIVHEAVFLIVVAVVYTLLFSFHESFSGAKLVSLFN